jgi:cell division protein ZapA
MKSRNYIRVTICGSEYYLFANDSEEYVRSIAREVEQQMSTLMRSSTRISVTAAAVMTALSCRDDELKAVASVDGLKAKINEAAAAATHFHAEAQNARQEMDQLKNQAQTLNDEIAALRAQRDADAAAYAETLAEAGQTAEALRTALSAEQEKSAAAEADRDAAQQALTYERANAAELHAEALDKAMREADARFAAELAAEKAAADHPR